MPRPRLTQRRRRWGRYGPPPPRRGRAARSNAMKDSIRQRLQKLADRYEEVGRLLASEEVVGGSRQFRELSVEYARLQPLAERLQRSHGLQRDVQAARELQADADAG